MNRLKDSQEILKTAMAKDPENAWVHINKGLLSLKQYKDREALHHYREAARIDPENTAVHDRIKQLQQHPVFWAMLVSGILGLIVILIEHFFGKK